MARTKTAPKKSSETAVLFMTDLHFGKKTKTFGAARLERRLKTFACKIADIRGLLGTGYEFKELVVCLLGDVIDGTGIYPSQPHHQEDTGALEQIEKFGGMMHRTLNTMAASFPRVRVECIPGNHGRVSKFASEADNWDLVAYQDLAARCRGGNVTVRYGGKDGLWMRRARIGRHNYLLYHGHGVKMYQNIPWYGLFTRAARWATTRKFGRFDAMACGHFHTCGYHPLNRIHMFLNGTAVTSDEWALEQFGYESSNQWWLVGSSDSHACTFQFPLEV